MTKPELLAFIRELTYDKTQPYQVSDLLINQFITEAEREFSERSLYFQDNKSVAVLSSTASYTIDSAIIFINSAKLSIATQNLQKTTRQQLDDNLSNWQAQTGIPLRYFQDSTKITLQPTPDAGFTLQLEYTRRPITDMETPLNLQQSLSYWVLHRIYQIPNTDILNLDESMKNLRAFEKVFGHKKSAEFEAAWRIGGNVNAFNVSQF